MNIPEIPPIDHIAEAAARARLDTLIKPPGSLGRLETLAVQLAGISGQPRPRLPRKTVIVMAGDHGVSGEGVSIAPAAVTAQMVGSFLHGQAAINVLTRQAGVQLVVVDVGVEYDLPPELLSHPNLRARRVARGTANISKGAAMTREQAEAAITVGLQVIADEVNAGLDVVALGEMGIGNTTASAAIVAALTGRPVANVTGRGSGLDDAALEHKIGVIEQALAVNQPDPQDPFDVLVKVGGLEIAGLVGVALGAAARRVPVVVDGFIAAVAALVAAELAPEIKPYLIAGHRSTERGHAVILERLGLDPLLTLDLRLGEGTGAVLAMHLLEAAARTLDEMATFGEAGIGL